MIMIYYVIIVNVVENRRGSSNMIYNINEELSNMNENKKRVDSIVENLKMKMDEYEKSIGLLKEELSVSRKELDLIKNSLVCVRLGDLIDEISWLSGVDKNKISTLLSFNKMFPSMEDAFSYIDNINKANDKRKK